MSDKIILSVVSGNCRPSKNAFELYKTDVYLDELIGINFYGEMLFITVDKLRQLVRADFHNKPI